MAVSDNGMPGTSTPRDNGLYSYDSFSGGRTEKGPRSSHFLWWCSGAYQDILRQCPSEQIRYAGLGGVLLATFVLASLSGGYAVYSVFDNGLWAFGFAIVWGLIIFNFDRFLVSTMRKYGVSRSRQWWLALPRFALALLIGLTIARPLELKIFEKEIEVQVAANRHKKILMNDSLLRAEDQSQLAVASLEKERLIQRQQGLQDTLHTLQQAYLQEADGTGGSFHRGIDKLTRLKQDAYQQALQQHGPELQQLDRQIAYQDSLIKSANAGREVKRKIYEGLVSADVGFLERNKALSDLSDKESSVWWANFLISVLIILIETGPVLSKLIMSTGPYDLALAKFELIQMADSEEALRADKRRRDRETRKQERAAAEEMGAESQPGRR